MEFRGSAGILPAAAGMLPAALALDATCWRMNQPPRPLRLEAARQNAGQSGQHARAPQPNNRTSP